VVGVVLYAGSLSTADIVASQQQSLWNVILLLPSFVVFVIAMTGETNRAPFDLPEAESELVGGFHTEYTSLKFAMFFLAEYINVITVSALCTTMFLGGWRAPWPISLWHDANTGWWPILWFTGKVVIGIFIFVWLRGTLPRLRYDQFMAFGWKVLIPINLVWILAITSIHVLHDHGWQWWRAITVPGCVVVIIGIIAITMAEPAAARRRAEREEEEAAEAAEAQTFPVPPMDLIVPTPPRMLTKIGASTGRAAELPAADLPASEEEK